MSETKNEKSEETPGIETENKMSKIPLLLDYKREKLQEVLVSQSTVETCQLIRNHFPTSSEWHAVLNPGRKPSLKTVKVRSYRELVSRLGLDGDPTTDIKIWMAAAKIVYGSEDPFLKRLLIEDEELSKNDNEEHGTIVEIWKQEIIEQLPTAQDWLVVSLLRDPRYWIPNRKKKKKQKLNLDPIKKLAKKCKIQFSNLDQGREKIKLGRRIYGRFNSTLADAEIYELSRGKLQNENVDFSIENGTLVISSRNIMIGSSDGVIEVKSPETALVDFVKSEVNDHLEGRRKKLTPNSILQERYKTSLKIFQYLQSGLNTRELLYRRYILNGGGNKIVANNEIDLILNRIRCEIGLFEREESEEMSSNSEIAQMVNAIPEAIDWFAVRDFSADEFERWERCRKQARTIKQMLGMLFQMNDFEEGFAMSLSEYGLFSYIEKQLEIGGIFYPGLNGNKPIYRFRNGHCKLPDFQVKGMRKVIELYGKVHYDRGDDSAELVSLYAEIGVDARVYWAHEISGKKRRPAIEDILQWINRDLPQ